MVSRVVEKKLIKREPGRKNNELPPKKKSKDRNNY
jgi:hypothetical protein